MIDEIEIYITKGVIECKVVAIIPVSNFNLSSLLCCQDGCGLELAHEQIDGESPHLHKYPFQYDDAFYGGETVVPSLLIHQFMGNERVIIESGSSLNFPPLVYRH